LLNEQKRTSGAKSRGEVNKYKALILQTISQHWLVPSGVDKNLSAELLIRLAPGGTVLDVQVIRSSGSAGLDRSARDAVFKASPLPVPSDSEGFDQFRQFVLKVKPENVIVHDVG
jgi:colicin import membrane protein